MRRHSKSILGARGLFFIESQIKEEMSVLWNEMQGKAIKWKMALHSAVQTSGCVCQTKNHMPAFMEKFYTVLNRMLKKILGFAFDIFLLVRISNFLIFFNGFF